jgi:rubrerythrin
VLVPMILAKDYFWGARMPAPARALHYCGRCGQSLEGVLDTHCPNCGDAIRRANGTIIR